MSDINVGKWRGEGCKTYLRPFSEWPGTGVLKVCKAENLPPVAQDEECVH